ncbi:MAG: translation initiation factor IF-2 associated domain-containing protein, partial [Hyphomicrobiales bacterium]|nr:translation initiation factor IF-2 associated domain-containing protein [Hyphomicrobiales bacterium]
MNETNNTDKPVGVAPPKSTLHLKRPIEQGTVRQSFSHGRSKAVVVEKVKRRVLGPGEAPPATSAKPTISVVPARPASAPGPIPTAPAKPTPAPPPKTGVVLPTLTAEQREARARALLDARAREEEDRRRQEAEAEARRERESRERAEREAAEARKREEELRRAQEANFRRQSEEEARRRLAGGEPAPGPSVPRKPQPAGVAPAAPLARTIGEEETRAARRSTLSPLAPQKVLVPTPRPARGGEQRNRGRLTVANATSIEEERTRSVASFRRRTQRLKGHGTQDQKEKIS